MAALNWSGKGEGKGGKFTLIAFIPALVMDIIFAREIGGFMSSIDAIWGGQKFRSRVHNLDQEECHHPAAMQMHRGRGEQRKINSYRAVVQFVAGEWKMYETETSGVQEFLIEKIRLVSAQILLL